ncbi:MAG: TrkA family potassium uptake protein [Clostridiales bacterium]|nr:TrkA family potassium uptake protein [Clostridiales bacterium]
MKKKKKPQDIFGVIGLGRFGLCLVGELARSGAEVLAVDRNPNLVREAREFTEFAYVAADYTKDTLSQMGIPNCSTVVICIDDRLDTSLLATLNVLNLNVQNVYVKAISPEHGELAAKIGAEVVYPERDMGVRLAKKLQANSVMEYISLSNDIDISEYPVPHTLVGKRVADCGLRSQYCLNIIAIQHDSDTTVSIDPCRVFQAEDTLVLIGKSSDLHRFENDLC